MPISKCVTLCIWVQRTGNIGATLLTPFSLCLHLIWVCSHVSSLNSELLIQAAITSAELCFCDCMWHYAPVVVRGQLRCQSLTSTFFEEGHLAAGGQACLLTRFQESSKSQTDAVWLYIGSRFTNSAPQTVW